MQKVTVKKETLLKALKENKTKHLSGFEKSMNQYQKRLVKILSAKLEEAKKPGKKVNLNFNLYPPSDHSGEYESVIKMLEMGEETTVELSQNEFQQYVLDEWNGHNFYSNSYRDLGGMNMNFSRTYFSSEIDNEETFLSNTGPDTEGDM